MKRRNLLLIGVACLLSLLWAGEMALAGNPHFIDSKTKIMLQKDGDLVVSFKEAGLGSAETTYQFSATVNALWTCVSKSGQCPQAANKVTTSEAVTTIGTFSPKNGTVMATLVISVPEPPSSAPPTCGGGQSLELSEISYTNIVLLDVTNSVYANLPDHLGPVTFFTCP